MNLKEKSKEAKEYGEIKSELIRLTEGLIERYKEYEDVYNKIITDWTNKIITEFKSVFQAENFTITDKLSDYSGVPGIDEKYKTIKAILYDLHFELSITNGGNSINFLQIKPETETKNIIIQPIVKRYYIKGNYIEIDGVSASYSNGKSSRLFKVERNKEKVKNAEFFIDKMQEFVLETMQEIELLTNELERIKGIQISSIAYPYGNLGIADSDKSYGDFENFSELIERI